MLRGNSFYVFGVIKASKSGKTYVYRDGKLVQIVDTFDNRLLDWILPQLPEYFDGEDRPMQLLLDGKSFFLGVRQNNQLFGRSIRFYRTSRELKFIGGPDTPFESITSDFCIAYYKDGRDAAGNWILNKHQQAFLWATTITMLAINSERDILSMAEEILIIMMFLSPRPSQAQPTSVTSSQIMTLISNRSDRSTRQDATTNTTML